MRRSRILEIARFVVAGGSTTIFSYAIYLGLLYLGVRYVVAYPVSFVAGVFWSYFVNSWFVFKRPPTWRGLAAFPLVYIVQLLFGTATVYVAVSWLGVRPWAGPLLAIAATLPLTYVLSRWLIRKTSAVETGARLDG